MIEETQAVSLPPQEQERLQRVAESFSAAWQDTGAAEMAHFLPPPGDSLRLVALRELVRLDLETRWRRELPVQIETYLARFPELGTPATVPADLIHEEYRVRHQVGDRPTLDTYRARFPAQYAELEKRIKAAPEPDSWATVAPSSPDDTIHPDAAEQPHTLLQSGDGYKLLKRIGSGSFAEVYQAEAPGGVIVAVKRLLQPVDAEEAQRELESLHLTKQLRHPYLLTVHAIWAESDRICVAMDLADGSLRERFKKCKQTGENGIPVHELLLYFRESAEALDFLHENKVIHRDIKPENILLLQGHAKVADFGLARMVQSQRMHASAAAGTPRYMPPEAWDHKVGTLDRPADQYSLAITYVELRRGQPPFPQADMMNLMLAHLKQTPDLAPLPEAEQKVLQKALSKSPGDRFGSCREFIRALEQAVLPELQRTNPELFASLGTASTWADGTMVSTGQQLYPPTVIVELRRRRVLFWVASGLLLLVMVLLAWRLLSPSPQMLASGVPASLPVSAGRIYSFPITPQHEGIEGSPSISFEEVPPLVQLSAGSDKENAETLTLTARIAPDAPPGLYRVRVLFGVGGQQRKEEEMELEIQPLAYYLPPGWAKGGEGTAVDGDHIFYKRINVAKDSLSVPFVFIPADEKEHLAAFYIMESKVATADYARFFAANREQLQNKEWKPAGGDKKPATSIPVEDAHRFAVWLVGEKHGFLPRVQQWDKAAGRFEPNRGQGPFIGTWPPATGARLRVAFNRENEGMMDCYEGVDDVSLFLVHDMAGNALEWTRNALEQGNILNNKEVPLSTDDKRLEFVVMLRGATYVTPKPLLFTALEGARAGPSADSPGDYSYFSQLSDLGFRVVIEP